MTNIILISRFAAIIDAIQKNGEGWKKWCVGLGGRGWEGLKRKHSKVPSIKEAAPRRIFSFHGHGQHGPLALEACRVQTLGEKATWRLLSTLAYSTCIF